MSRSTNCAEHISDSVNCARYWSILDAFRTSVATVLQDIEQVPYSYEFWLVDSSQSLLELADGSGHM
jgi:hypothetical protein